MLKKITLLAMAVAAFAAFAAPSMASADFWYTGDERLGGFEERDNVHFTGTLSSTKKGLKISCNATANVTLWNEEATGTGEVDELNLTAETEGGCTVGVLVAPNTYADVSGCHVKQATTEKFPWHVNVLEGTGIDIENANFTNEFNGCAALGIPNGFKAGAEGTVTGQVEGGCIIFNESGDMPETKIDGSLCSTEPLHLTAE
jgi:hypothetical protein